MSGPIVRKYGFPNFEKIFGERPLEHGAESEVQAEEEKTPKSDSKASEKTSAKKKSASKKK